MKAQSSSKALILMFALSAFEGTNVAIASEQRQRSRGHSQATRERESANFPPPVHSPRIRPASSQASAPMLPPTHIPPSRYTDTEEFSPNLSYDNISGSCHSFGLGFEEWQIQKLTNIIGILIKKYTIALFPKMAELTIEAYSQELENPNDSNSLTEMFNLALCNQDTFRYVTRDQRPPRQSVAMYSFASRAITDEDGIINKIKRNIMDEIFLWLALFISEIPEEASLRLETFIDHILFNLSEALKTVMFEVLRSDRLAEEATCCSWGRPKFSQEAANQIISGLGGILGSAVDRFLGQGFSANASQVVSGIFSAISRQ